MCGICGVYGQPSTTHSIRVMLSALVHRGPDGEGVCVDNHCGLGHRRLAILDLSPNGRQPMRNESGSVWSAVNGEIYNYKTLRAHLQAAGHTFRSECDSEVIPHLYEELGDQFVEHLRGMFGLALYDQRERKLILARDPSGEKPVYYAQDGCTLYFASEIKAILRGGFPAHVNETAIPDWLMLQYTPSPNTLFEGVHKLPAGHTLTASPAGIRLRQYWCATNGRDTPGTTTVVELRRVLDESVRLRLQSDVPVGAFLSGGVDSSATVALYRRRYSGPIHTFTATFGNNCMSEAPYAQQVSQHLGTIQHEVVITPQMVVNDLERITWHHDEPLGDAAIICNYFLAREAKRHVGVVLAGEGGDELFGGYPWHRYTAHAQLVEHIPRWLKRAGLASLHALRADDLGSPLYALGRVLQWPCQEGVANVLLYPTTAVSRPTLQRLLLHMNGLPTPTITAPQTMNGLDRALATDYLNLLPEKFLMKADKATMAWAVEERLPLLDQAVVRLAFSLPSAMRRNKRALREAVADLLPHTIAWRPKQGFGTPVAAWLLSPEIREMVMDRLTNGPLLRELASPQALRRVTQSLTTPRRGKATLCPSGALWGLFTLQVWHDVWFGGRQ